MNDLLLLLQLSFLIVSIAAVLLLPTIVALIRRCKNIGFIFLVNMLGVWIGIGWFVAMAWAIFGESDNI